MTKTSVRRHHASWGLDRALEPSSGSNFIFDGLRLSFKTSSPVAVPFPLAPFAACSCLVGEAPNSVTSIGGATCSATKAAASAEVIVDFGSTRAASRSALLCARSCLLWRRYASSSILPTSLFV